MKTQLFINILLLLSVFILSIFSFSANVTTAENLREIDRLYRMHDELQVHVQDNRDRILMLEEAK